MQHFRLKKRGLNLRVRSHNNSPLSSGNYINSTIILQKVVGSHKQTNYVYGRSSIHLVFIGRSNKLVKSRALNFLSLQLFMGSRVLQHGGMIGNYYGERAFGSLWPGFKDLMHVQYDFIRSACILYFRIIVEVVNGNKKTLQKFQ